MSGYEKSQDSYVYGYTTTRPSQEQSYPGLTQPSFDPQYPSTEASVSHAVSSTHQMPFLGQPFEPRDTAFPVTSPAPLIDTRSRFSPEITSTGPFSGIASDTFRLSFRSQIDYTGQDVSFFLMFGSAASKATLSKNFHREPYFHYTLEAQIPSFASTKATEGTMPLLLEVLGEKNHPMTMKTLENFTYLDISPYARYQSTHESRKRKYTDESTGYGQLPTKRTASQPLQTRPSSMYPPNTEPYSFDNPLYALPGSYDRPILQPARSYIQPITQKPNYQYSPGSQAHSSMKTRSPSVGGYGSYTNMAHPSASPQLPTTPRVSRSHIEVAATTTANAPPLIRTSILQPQATGTPRFNPYTLYPSAKAELEIQGDLQSMCDGWTEEELKVKRRLVEFRRSQEGSIITTSFRPVTIEERTPNSPCISCIWWEERDQFYVTSVDTIQLLESLVGVRFTVEEKNRIRRNLEGYKPMTISKQKEDCESFFRLIMGFPNPKPRNIEKDVKVFHWSSLEIALKKIIGKYSASYASTSAILQTTSSGGYGSSVSEPAGLYPTASPQSTTSSVASHPYHPGMTSTAMASNIAGSAGPEVTVGAYEPLRTLSQPISSMGHWQTHYPPVSGISHYATGPSASGRSSWDIHPYNEHGSPGTAPAAQQLQYYSGDVPSEHLHSPSSKPYPAHSQPTSHG